MPVTSTRKPPRLRRLALLLSGLSLVAFATSAFVLVDGIETGQDLVQIRNALLYRVGPRDAYEWTPQSVPSSFLLETGAKAAPGDFNPALTGLLAHASSEFQAAMMIAEHLAKNRRVPAIPIKSNTFDAYRAIREQGLGYCADYTQVFNALAYSAGLTSREWGMSFDQYGGDGHAFNEVYDSSLHKWVFIDPFYSFYVEGTDGVPLSVQELRGRLLRGDTDSVVVRQLGANAFRFKSAADALAYYRRGMDELYMIWGNNVLSYDENAAIRLAAPFGRSVEQLVGIVIGEYPDIMLAPEYVDGEALRHLKAIRTEVVVLCVAFIGLLLSGSLVLASLWHEKRASARLLRDRGTG